MAAGQGASLSGNFAHRYEASIMTPTPSQEPPKRKQQPRRKRKLRAENYELARKVMGGVKEET